MAEILLENNYVTQNDVEKCIHDFYNLNEEDKQFQIVFSQEVQEIDILLIAYLILFKRLKFDINISIKLNGNTKNKTELIFKLYQYLEYGFLMTGKSVFKIYPNRYSKTGLIIDENSPPNIFHQFFTLSKSFIPILLVENHTITDNIDLYKVLFQEKIKDLSIYPEDVIKETNSDDQYKNFNRWIKGYKDNEKGEWVPGIINISDRISCIYYLARLAFYNVLNQAKITRFYFSTYKEQIELNIGNLPTSINTDGKYPHIEFFNKTKWIFDDLSNQPPIYHFIYSQLLSSDLFPTSFSGENLNNENENIIKLLHSLWNYTKEIVSGINELAKNIKEHADPPIGLITGRIYKCDKWSELKRNIYKDNSLLDDYLLKVNNLDYGEELAFFDLNVIDLGEKSIIETLKNKTNDLLVNSQSLSPILNEDLEIIAKGNLNLCHFLDFSVGNTLIQQSKKSIAHLGLLIFSKLVNDNNGFIRAGSTSGKGTLCYPTQAHPVPFGTNYHIVLPISKKRKFISFLPHPINVPLESAPIEIVGIEEMLDYKVVSINNIQKIDKKLAHEKWICLIKIELQINDRGDVFKVWENIDEEIKSYVENLSDLQYIYCIDFEGSKINESDLFRFIGLWNLVYPKFSLILINIETYIFKNLIDLNELFIEKFKKGSNDTSVIWNENSPFLIYCYDNPKNNEERFYFTNILWGKDKYDFYFANKLISKTNFNAVILFRSIDHEENYAKNNLSFLAQSGLFYSKTTLLPFDLLLPGTDGLTIFENTASVLLQNELNIQHNNNLKHE